MGGKVFLVLPEFWYLLQRVLLLMQQMVGDAGTPSASKYKGTGVPLGMKNQLSVATMSSLDKDSKGDTRQGGVRGNNEDEDMGDSVIMHSGKNMLRWIGSSPLRMAGGRGPFNHIV